VTFIFIVTKPSLPFNKLFVGNLYFVWPDRNARAIFNAFFASLFYCCKKISAASSMQVPDFPALAVLPDL